MPELPEVEITARRLDAALRGAEIESTLAPGINALKTFDPPLHALDGRAIAGLRRIGKHLVIDVAGDEPLPPRPPPPGGRALAGLRGSGKPLVTEGAGDEPLHVLVHLMSAGRLQLYDKRASLRDRTSRLLIRTTDGRELRLREFGTKQRAWAKLLPAAQLEDDEAVATLGPDAYPPPPLAEFEKLLDQP